MKENEFISWLEGYLEGVSYDIAKPNPVVQTILYKIKLVKKELSKEITIDTSKVINVPPNHPFKDNKGWQNPYIVTYTNDKQILKG